MIDFYLFMLMCMVSVFGYVLMKQVDHALNEGESRFEKADCRTEPVCVFFDGKLDEKEIMKEIRRFKENYKEFKVCFYVDSQTKKDHG